VEHGQTNGIIANSGKVGEFVDGRFVGSFGVAAGDPGNASKRRGAGWISVPKRDADARVTAAQVHFTHAPVTESGVVEFEGWLSSSFEPLARRY